MYKNLLTRDDLVYIQKKKGVFVKYNNFLKTEPFIKENKLSRINQFKFLKELQKDTLELITSDDYNSSGLALSDSDISELLYKCFMETIPDFVKQESDNILSDVCYKKLGVVYIENNHNSLLFQLVTENNKKTLKDLKSNINLFRKNLSKTFLFRNNDFILDIYLEYSQLIINIREIKYNSTNKENFLLDFAKTLDNCSLNFMEATGEGTLTCSFGNNYNSLSNNLEFFNLNNVDVLSIYGGMNKFNDIVDYMTINLTYLNSNIHISKPYFIDNLNSLSAFNRQVCSEILLNSDINYDNYKFIVIPLFIPTSSLSRSPEFIQEVVDNLLSKGYLVILGTDFTNSLTSYKKDFIVSSVRNVNYYNNLVTDCSSSREYIDSFEGTNKMYVEINDKKGIYYNK